MSAKIELNAETRSDTGKGASRRLRRTSGLVPGIVYGGTNPAIAVTVKEKELNKAMEREVFFSQILNVKIDGGDQQAVVRDMQRHPATGRVMHIDFMRIRADRAIVVHIPLHYLNEEACVGVKSEGGSITHSLTEVEISCLPAALPEFIEIDMLDVHLGDVLHLSDLEFPDGVVSTALALGEEHDTPIASIQTPRGGADDEEEEAADSADAEAGDADAGAAEGSGDEQSADS